MLSMRTFSESQNRHAAETLQRGVCILLEGISLNAFRGVGAPVKAFQNTLSTLRTQFAGLAFNDEDREISLCNKAVACLERYGDETERLGMLRTHELQATLSMFTEALVRIGKNAGAEAEAAATALARVGKDLLAALEVDDLTVVNSRVRQSLDAICAATERHEHLRDEIERGLTLGRQHHEALTGDPATGLPQKQDAIQALSLLTEGTRPGHVLAFVIDHFDAINTRFGASVSIGVLQTFAQHLAQHMHASEKLFRWHGSGFVAITDEGIPDSMLAAEAARIAVARVQYSNSVGARDFVLPITCSWTMLPVSPGAPLAGVVSMLDEFAAGKLAGSRHRGHGASRRY